MTQMEMINNIWKDHTGSDLTEQEAVKMVDFIKYVMAKVDQDLDNMTEA